MNPIQLLQKKTGLNPDGIIGPNTFNGMCIYFGLNSIQLAHFLGQCDHETGGFNVFEEDLRYSKERLLVIFKKYYTPELARQHEKKPQLIANHVYGGRLGNKDLNDGWNFRGRGCIQLTGKDNYERFANWIKDLSIINSPSQVADKYAFESALWYFENRSLFDLCEDVSEKTIELISKGVNLGNPFSSVTPNGMQDRIEKTKYYAEFID